MNHDDVVRNARVLWDYHRFDHSVMDADFVLAMGCADLRVAKRAAEMVLDGVADHLVTSGGFGKISRHTWSKPEARMFFDEARRCGVSEDQILVEEQAANTGENIAYTKRLLERTAAPNAGRNITRAMQLLARRSLPISSGVLVCKPYMERRSLATAQQQWPAVNWSVTSPDVSLLEYATQDVPFDEMVALMVGDLHRIVVYAKRGYQVPQDVPPDVWSAFEALIDAGYDAHLVPDARRAASRRLAVGRR